MNSQQADTNNNMGGTSGGGMGSNFKKKGNSNDPETRLEYVVSLIYKSTHFYF